MRNLIGLNFNELQGVAADLGMPRFAARQLCRWLYVKYATRIDDMTDISKDMRARLSEQFQTGYREPTEVVRSVDGTEKYLFPTDSGHYIETVYIPDGDRATLCVSTQIGCKMNCLFCQTGKQGWQGNLTAADILSQVVWAQRKHGLSNLVLMGQGEPFDNLDAVMHALDILTSKEGFGWSPHRITVSTVGLKKNLSVFLDQSECHLAISLHSPLHEQRLALMPAERQFSVADMVELLRQYDFSHQRRLSFEYIVFKGVNDSIDHARALLKLLRGLDCRINLIRFHRIPNVDLEGADMETMLRFRDFLTQHGLFTTIRSSRGEDIWAACGMLNTARMEKQENPAEEK